MKDEDEEPVGPLKGEKFTQTLARLAHELHGTPLDQKPAKRMPEEPFLKRLERIWNPPTERDAGEDDE